MTSAESIKATAILSLVAESVEVSRSDTNHNEYNVTAELRSGGREVFRSIQEVRDFVQAGGCRL